MREAALDAARGAPDASPSEIVAVGGTAANLLKLLPVANLDHGLHRDQIAEAVAVLTTEPAALVAERYLVRPMRARILPAGAAILDAILEHYGVERLRISEAGIREGVILAVDHAGLAWRDQLAQLAHGWRS
jgi:exopolyphosphatase/pppGpp-phosphohydrolase